MEYKQNPFKKLINVVFLTIVAAIFASMNIQDCFQNGIRNNFGIDFLPPLNLDNTSLSLGVEFKPSMAQFDANEKRTLIFKVIDIDTNTTYIPDLYEITILKNQLNNEDIVEKVFLNNSFYSRNNSLILEFNSQNTTIKDEKNYNKTITQNNTITSDEKGIVKVINTPNLDSGTYHLKVNVKISDERIPIKSKILKFDSYLSLGDILDINTIGNKNSFTLLSYNDKIVDYKYNNKTNEISFEIPFKYNLTRIEEGFIYIHTEIKVPETFKEIFDAKKYLATINDVNATDIGSAAVSVDRFSNSSNVIIHFILDSNSLFKLTKERIESSVQDSRKTLKFTIVPKYSI